MNKMWFAVLPAALLALFAGTVRAQERDRPQKLDQLFERCDRNHDGVISREEFGRGLRKVAGQPRQSRPGDRRARRPDARSRSTLSPPPAEPPFVPEVWERRIREETREAAERIMREGIERIHDQLMERVQRTVERQSDDAHERIHDAVRHAVEESWRERMGEIDRMIHETVQQATRAAHPAPPTLHHAPPGPAPVSCGQRATHRNCCPKPARPAPRSGEAAPGQQTHGKTHLAPSRARDLGRQVKPGKVQPVRQSGRKRAKTCAKQPLQTRPGGCKVRALAAGQRPTQPRKTAAPAANPRTRQMLKHLDSDRDGTLTLEEFGGDAREFKGMDRDGSGRLDANELAIRPRPKPRQKPGVRSTGRNKPRPPLRAGARSR